MKLPEWQQSIFETRRIVHTDKLNLFLTIVRVT